MDQVELDTCKVESCKDESCETHIGLNEVKSTSSNVNVGSCKVEKSLSHVKLSWVRPMLGRVELNLHRDCVESTSN